MSTSAVAQASTHAIAGNPGRYMSVESGTTNESNARVAVSSPRGTAGGFGGRNKWAWAEAGESGCGTALLQLPAGRRRLK